MFNAWIDMLFACGGLFWIIFAVHFFVARSTYAPLGSELPHEAMLFFVGSVLFNNAHIAATLVRLYGNKETRNKLWFHSYGSLLLFIPLLLLSLVDSVVMSMCIRIYAILTFDHSLSQNYGVTLMYCYRGGYRLELWEKRTLKVFHHAMIWYGVLRQFTYIEFCPKRNLGFDVPKLGPMPEIFCNVALVVLVVSGLVTLGFMVRRAVKQNSYMPVPALFLLLTSTVISTAGFQLSSALFLFTPAFLHSIQYLVITTSFHLRDNGIAEGAKPQEMAKLLLTKGNLKYWMYLLIIGCALFGIAPALLCHLGVSFTYAWAITFVVVSFHHFLADSALWKLRDAKVRQNLVGAPTR